MPTTRIQLDAALNDDRLPEMETLLDGQDHKKVAGRDDWFIRMGRYWSGLSADVEVIDLCNGPISILVLPTRGMGIWQARTDDVIVGWDSPLSQPVHPQFVNLQNRNGLGWLEGFNELICRCGLSFNGPPGHDEGAKSSLESDITLHGRIANLPASKIELFYDDEQGTIGASGVVEEAVLFGPQLRMKSTIVTKIGSTSFTVIDEVTNFGASPTELQLLYHTNIGKPFLGEDSRLECAATRVVPRDGTSARGVATHETCLGPTKGFEEQVFYYSPIADEQGFARAMLRNSAGDQAVSLEFKVDQLPCFSFWKCTQEEEAGYVAGLEPGTNYPNFKTFERHHGRVIQLAPGETYTTQIQMQIHLGTESVSEMSSRIAELQGERTIRVDPCPVAPFCPID